MVQFILTPFISDVISSPSKAGLFQLKIFTSVQGEKVVALIHDFDGVICEIHTFLTCFKIEVVNETTLHSYNMMSPFLSLFIECPSICE